MTLSKEEMQADLNATIEDIANLTTIVDGIRRFMARSRGEDRSAFSGDMLKYGWLLQEAMRLRSIIAERLEAKP